MRLTESDVWNIYAKATNEAGISASPAQLDKAAAALVKVDKALRFMKRAVFVAGVIEIAAAVAVAFLFR